MSDRQSDVERSLEDRNKWLAALNGLAIELASLPSEANLQQFLVQWLKSLTGAVAVAFNDFDPVARVLITRHLEVAPGIMQKILAVLGKKLRDVRSPVNDEMYGRIIGTVVGVRETLTEISFGAIPPLVSAALQRLLGFDRCVAMAFVIEGELYGTAAVMINTGENEPSYELLGSFAHLAAVSLRRRRAEEDLRRSEEELARSRKMAAIGQLAAGVAHEINNPLTVIIGTAQLHLNNLKESNALREDFAVIEAHASRCKAIVSELVKFSREEKMPVEEIDVREVIDATVDFLGGQRTFSKVIIKKEYAPGVARIMGNAEHLQNVFIHLMLNARDAMPAGGTLTISTFKSDSEIRIVFTDSGEGIPEDLLEKIFHPFFTTREAGKGIGLGLAICADVVEKHKGRIWAESKKGEGAAFTITLPVDTVS